jgi:hypothetical protein
VSKKHYSKLYGYNQQLDGWFSSWKNNVTYLHYYYLLKELAINMYKWEGLPDTIDERFLELTLFENGYGVYFNDDVIGNLFLQCTIGGQLNLYRIPINRMAYSVGNNSYHKYLTEKDSVIVFNNYLHTTTHISIDMFAQKLYNISRTIDVNINAQKTPILITCDDKQKMTFKNAYQQYEGNEPFIFGYKGFDKEAFQVLQTDAPFVADKLSIEKNRVWNEAMLFLGINNNNMDKKERQISDEVNSNLEQITMSRMVGLNSRKQGAAQINRMFGTNITVEYNEELNKMNTDLVSGGEQTAEVEEVE